MYEIKDVISKDTKNHIAEFDCYRQGTLYYIVKDETGKSLWQFPIDITDTNDIGSAAFGSTYKPITLMRYVRKSIQKETLIKLTK